MKHGIYYAFWEQEWACLLYTSIMRIHGTFVNFLDLSPDIQEDIIKRLDMESTSM